MIIHNVSSPRFEFYFQCYLKGNRKKMVLVNMTHDDFQTALSIVKQYYKNDLSIAVLDYKKELADD